MKKHTIIIGISLLGLLVGLTACDDWLDLYPQDQVPKQFYWKTKEDVSSAVTGIYSSALGNVTNMFLWGEMRADMWLHGRVVRDGNLERIRSGEITATNGYCRWSGFYSTINNCNILLKFARDAYENDDSFTQSALYSYEAQAVAVRSLMFFYLTRTYGDIPFPMTAYVDDSESLEIAKTSQKVVLDSLSTQLERICKIRPETGTSDIPYSYGNNDKNKGYMTHYAVKALLADIYLWQGEYEKALTACDEIINSGQFALIPVSREEFETDEGMTVYHANVTAINDFFNALYRKGNSVESIFELQFARDVTNPFYSYMSPRVNNTIIPNTEHINSEIFPTTESGDREYEDIRKAINTKSNYIWKYVGISYESNESLTAEEMTSNYIVYRLADIYLMKAEALAQIGKRDGDQTYLQRALDNVYLIRTRANAVETTDISSGGASLNATAVEQFILDERARELMFEGKRWFDVLRNARRDNYANISYLLNIVSYSTPSDKVYSVLAKYRNVNSHYLPVPQSDLDANTLLVQNPFYDTTSK